MIKRKISKSKTESNRQQIELDKVKEYIKTYDDVELDNELTQGTFTTVKTILLNKFLFPKSLSKI